MNTLPHFAKNALRCALIPFLLAVISSCFGKGDPIETPAQNPPQVQWVSISNITDSGATLTAEITDDGNQAIIDGGFCYLAGFDANPTVENALSISAGAQGIGPFEVKLTGLPASTGFAVRAWARTSAGIGYSEARPLTTKAADTPGGNGGNGADESIAASDLNGTYTISAKLITGTDEGVIIKETTSWTDVSVRYGSDGLLLLVGLVPTTSGQGSGSDVAIGSYDASTKEVYIFGGWYSTYYYWWYTSNPDQKYVSLLYPINIVSIVGSHVTWNYLEWVTLGNYDVRGLIKLKASKSSGNIVLTPATEQAYHFESYTLDTSSWEVGSSLTGISLTYELVKMTRTGASSAPALAVKNNNYVQKTDIPGGPFSARVLR